MQTFFLFLLDFYLKGFLPGMKAAGSHLVSTSGALPGNGVHIEKLELGWRNWILISLLQSVDEAVPEMSIYFRSSYGFSLGFLSCVT